MSSRSNIIRAEIADVPMLRDQALAYIGIGSNIGVDDKQPQHTLEQAFLALATLSALPLIVSSLWESQPIDCPPDSPLFINAVAALSPITQDPHHLLSQLQQIEQDFGRQRTGQRNAPRTLDLDLLSYAGIECDDEVLCLPHPRLHQRAFVVFPLLEISPDYRDPSTSRPLRDVQSALAGQGLRKLRKNA